MAVVHAALVEKAPRDTIAEINFISFFFEDELTPSHCQCVCNKCMCLMSLFQSSSLSFFLSFVVLRKMDPLCIRTY